MSFRKKSPNFLCLNWNWSCNYNSVKPILTWKGTNLMGIWFRKGIFKVFRLCDSWEQYPYYILKLNKIVYTANMINVITFYMYQFIKLTLCNAIFLFMYIWAKFYNNMNIHDKIISTNLAHRQHTLNVMTYLSNTKSSRPVSDNPLNVTQNKHSNT